MKIKPVKGLPPAAQGGFTLHEALLLMMLMGVLLAIALVSHHGVRHSANEVRLRQHARTLNRALQTYRMHGGEIPPNASAEAVLALLKTEMSSAEAARHPGLRYALVDARLRGVRASRGMEGRRLVWDNAGGQFLLSDAGEGWSEIVLDESLASVDHGHTSRRAMLPFAAREPWVWDYADVAIYRSGPSRWPLTQPGLEPLEPDPPDGMLLPPLVDPASGEYAYGSYPLHVTITNPNPPGAAKIIYRIGDSEWATWSGGLLVLPREYVHEMEAYAEASDGESAERSSSVHRDYTTYYIQGLVAGSFASPRGDADMEFTVSGAQEELLWGRVQSPGQSQSRLALNAAGGLLAGPGETFSLGTLQYRNGLSRAGTNASEVALELQIPLSAPANTTVTVTLQLGMDNTIHYPWTPAGERYDWLHLPEEVTISDSLVIHDKAFRLQLKLMAPGAEPETGGQKVPILEGGTMDVALLASLEPR